MENHCVFIQNHKCIEWMDCELTHQELDEADPLCHGNQIEIQRFTKRFDILEALLCEAGINVPDDF